VDTLTASANPQESANKGLAIYDAKYKAFCEHNHPGKYIAIDITTEKAWVADQPEQALGAAQGANPNGFFHIIRIGSPGVFRVGYAQGTRKNSEWFT
jgi:hypothetical protein